MNTPKNNNSIKLIDSEALAKKIAKSILYREYAARFDHEFYEKDESGKDKIDSHGNKIYTDQVTAQLFHLYVFYLGIIKEHKVTECIGKKEVPPEPTVEEKERNRFMEWVRSLFKMFLF